MRQSTMLLFVVLLFSVVVNAVNITAEVDFANNNWMCADVSCSEYVKQTQ
jgi:hypothetical protein